MATSIKDITLVPKGYQQITDLATAQALTVPNGARFALLHATEPARWRDDGVAPTSSVGMPLATDTPLFYNGDLRALRIIDVDAAGQLNVVYYA